MRQQHMTHETTTLFCYHNQCKASSQIDVLIMYFQLTNHCFLSLKNNPLTNPNPEIQIVPIKHKSDGQLTDGQLHEIVSQM